MESERNRPSPSDDLRASAFRRAVPVLRVVLVYFVVGCLWILFSDKLLLLFPNEPNSMVFLSTIKGWFYVLVTSTLLWFLVRSEMRRRSALEAELREGIGEKAVLLFELNHRVKNNLQVISSILNLEAEDIEGDEARDLNDRTRARLKAMSLAHDRLFESGDLARIELGSYARVLWAALGEIYQRQGATVDFELDEAWASAELAVPFGLLAAEAMTNALRFGSRKGEGARVSIALKRDGGSCALTVRDEGLGLPEGSEGLGLRLMKAMVEQLRGSLALYNENGALVRAHFPLPEVEYV
jgi:two-component sensor histidine kinase